MSVKIGMEKEIKVSIKIKSSDMYHFLVKHFYSHFSGIFGVILSLGALAAFFLSIGKRQPMQLIILIILASLFTVIQPLQFLLKANQQVKLNPMFKEPLLYTINNEGVTVEQKEDKVLLPWTDIRKIVESNKAIFIYSSTVNAFILPKEQMKEEYAGIKEIIKEKASSNICKLK